MAPSNSSRGSSPLSDAISSPPDIALEEDPNLPSVPQPNGSAGAGPSGSQSPDRSARSDTSSTRRLGSQAPTELTDLSDEDQDPEGYETEVGNGEDQINGVDEWVPLYRQATGRL